MLLLLPFVFGQEPTSTMALPLGANVATISNDGITKFSLLHSVPQGAFPFVLKAIHDASEQWATGSPRWATASLGGIVGAVFMPIVFPSRAEQQERVAQSAANSGNLVALLNAALAPL